MLVKLYNTSNKNSWDQFVTNSCNSHFIFYRDFMEYHSDRFNDYSMMVYRNDKLIAIIPANIKDGVVYSHQGLTFAGILTNTKSQVQELQDILAAIILFLRTDDIQQLSIKCPPQYVYLRASSDMEYVLYQFNAQLISRDLGAVIDLEEENKYSKGRKHNIVKAKKNNLTLQLDANIEAYYQILESTLAKHGVKPVHSLDELKRLQARFPEYIKCHLVESSDGVPLAGCILFEWKHFIHTQYLASSPQGQVCGALDYLIDQLIISAKSDSKYFSFGVSTTNQGKELNHGLLMQKQGFGAHTQLQDCYLLNLKDK